MYQLIDTLEKPQNWLYSFLILLSVGVWLISFLGFTKSLAQHNADFGGDIGDMGNAGDVDGGWFDVLDFGAVPITVWLTLLFLIVGSLGITLNSWFLPALPTNALYNIVWTANLGASSLVSYWVVRKVAKPLSFLFRDYGVAEQASALVGKVARVSSGKVTAESGQACLQANGNSLEVAVRTHDTDEAIVYGQMVLLLHFDEDKNVYWCEKYETI